MASTSTEALHAAREFAAANVGPISAARHRRNFMIYGALCVLGLLPTLLGATPAWRAAGLGLLLPGGGFPALGGAWLLALPVTLALTYLAIIVWFWCGMVAAPLLIWFGSALLAGALAGAELWSGAYVVTPLAIAGLVVYVRRQAAARAAADIARHALRQGFFGESLAEVNTRAAAEAADVTGELTPDQLLSVRYLLDRALQPVGEYAGYTIIDQFQPAALRYQINHLGYALGLVQGHYTPSFRGYLGQAQRNLIETYLNRRVWDYWVLESMWGHFNFSDFDPAQKDNIMLTGYFGMQVNQYMLNSGDRRYAEAGSLSLATGLGNFTDYSLNVGKVEGPTLKASTAALAFSVGFQASVSVGVGTGQPGTGGLQVAFGFGKRDQFPGEFLYSFAPPAVVYGITFR